jgi:NADPH-dependent 7-cyano-7-deazaguanine reductase QueF
MSIQNTQEVTQIYFESQVQAFCPLANDYYNASIRVAMTPDKEIMDYCETDKFIKSLGGKHLIIEDLVAVIYKNILQYKPKYLKVSVRAESSTHFPVIVTKESK